MSLQANCHGWMSRCLMIAKEASRHDLHHDLGAVMCRIERDAAKERGLEPGCAYRLLRLASSARIHGHAQLARQTYELASEVIREERDPSPDWITMCEEEGWPVD